MLFVVGPGLLVVENRAFGDPFPLPLNIQLPRLCSNRRERNPLLLLVQCINTAFDQINGALPQTCVDFLFEPGMWLMLWVFVGIVGRM